MLPYIRNAWYMAAWEEEVEGAAVLARTLLDEDWSIYRLSGDGGYAVLADRCPHRFAPLHKGRRDGDALACPYHGLTFNADGQCVRNPFAPRPPPAARVRSLPAVARHGAVWFWPGDPQKADRDLIPDFSALDDPEPIVRGKTLFNASHEIIIDNLMDLSHAEFIHVDSFRTEGKIFAGEHTVVEADDGAVWSNWSMRNTQRPPWLAAFPEGARLDEWLEMRWHAPASMLLYIGFTQAGQPRAASPVRPMVNPHIITPQTATTSHYFFTRSPGEDSERMARQVFDEEDGPMLENIQRYMAGRDLMSMKPVILNVDAAAMRVRQRLAAMRRDELQPA